MYVNNVIMIINIKFFFIVRYVNESEDAATNRYYFNGFI